MQGIWFLLFTICIMILFLIVPIITRTSNNVDNESVSDFKDIKFYNAGGLSSARHLKFNSIYPNDNNL